MKHQSYAPKEFYGPLGQGGATGKFDMSEFKGPVSRPELVQKEPTDTPCVFFLDWEMVSVGGFFVEHIGNFPCPFSFFEFEKSKHFLDVANGLFFA